MKEKIRFLMVGAVNTATDFGVLFVLSVLAGIPVYIANVISTTAALVVSYGLNKKAVFKDTDTTNARKLLLFIGVTLFGLWVVQNIVIWAVSGMVHSLLHTDDAVTLFVAKVIATAFSLTWNYLWYSRVVFRQQNPREK